VILYYSIVPASRSGTFRTVRWGCSCFRLVTYARGARLNCDGGVHDPRLVVTHWEVLAVVFRDVHACGVEGVQSFLAHSHGNFGDVLVNVLDAAIAVTGWRIFTRYVRFYRAKRVGELYIGIE